MQLSLQSDAKILDEPNFRSNLIIVTLFQTFHLLGFQSEELLIGRNVTISAGAG